MTEVQTSQDLTFRFVGGRRFHGVEDAPYHLPNDEPEQVRLNQIQYSIRTTLGTNIIAPIPSNPSFILDIGAGSGRWAVEVAEEYPETQVIGLDLSPVRPPYKPANCTFQLGNLLKDLKLVDEGKFDFIHSRMLNGGIKAEQWDGYVEDIFRILKPGGWVQMAETNMITWDDDSVPEGSAYLKFRKRTEELFDQKGLCRGGKHLKPRLEKAGFVDIQVHEEKMIVGDWDGDTTKKDVGMAWKDVFGKLVKPVVHQWQELPDEKAREQFADQVLDDFYNGNYHLYFVIGRKPQA